MAQREIAPGPVDHTLPTGKWTFDGDVTAVFDDMLRRSIPQYDVMREMVFAVGRRFVQPGSDVVDLGCSRGEAIAPFVDAFGATARYVGVEVSAPMRAVCAERFAGLIGTRLFRLLDTDLRYDYPAVSASLTLSVFTAQFVPIEYRQALLSNAWTRTRPGGALVLVEKVLGAGSLDRLLVDVYYDMKRAHGYSQEEIDRKRFSLEGVLVPVTAAWNEDMLRAAGFAEVEMLWRWANFAAWVAVRR